MLEKVCRLLPRITAKSLGRGECDGSSFVTTLNSISPILPVRFPSFALDWVGRSRLSS